MSVLFLDGCEEYEGMVLQVKGLFETDGTGRYVLPDREELQARFFLYRHTAGSQQQVRVESVFSETNFDHLSGSEKHENHLHQTQDVFVRMGSIEQASFVLGLKDFFMKAGRCGGLMRYQFSLPSKNEATRAVYRTIGGLVRLLRQVDSTLRKSGAIKGAGGLPVLPDHYVHTDEFDETVRALHENMQKQDEIGIASPKEELHAYLVSRRRVNRKTLQAVVDRLVTERINVLMKLCNYDLNEFPFNFQREYI